MQSKLFINNFAIEKLKKKKQAPKLIKFYYHSAT